MGELFVFAAIHVLLPIALLAWHWQQRVSSRAQWLARTGAFAAFFSALHFAGFWLVLPKWLSYLYLAAFATLSVVTLVRALRLPNWDPGSARSIADIVVHTAFMLLFAMAAGYAASGRNAPQIESVELVFPLRGATYAVASGGSNCLLNFHLRALNDPALRAWRGQSHAVDLVALNSLGVRASGFAPGDPVAYAIYGAPIHAPCHGIVVSARDGLPDYDPPQRDRENLAGNYVLIDCGGIHVLLAHMQRGSVGANAGMQLSVGQTVGKVGNSGNSAEPHLHIHAQLPGSSDRIFDGAPQPLRFGGRYLSRNDILHVE